MIKLQDVSLIFKRFKLMDINLHIKPGEYCILLGPSGAGKTLLMESIAGLHELSSGNIYLKARNTNKMPPETRKVGIVYQNYALFPHLTVEENIAYGLKQQGLSPGEQRELVKKMADFFDINHLLKQLPPKLSGGEQQRTALARALVVDPEVLLLDEPLSALDNRGKKKTRQELQRVHNELNKTILHITHDISEALSLGDKIAVMDKGRIVQYGTPHQVFQTPANQFVAEFIGHENIFRATVSRKDKRKIDLGGVEFFTSEGNMLPGKESSVLLPPEGIILSQKPIKSSARNCFRGTVTSLEATGFITKVTLEIGIPVVVRITAGSAREMDIKVGDKLYAVFKATSLHFFSWGFAEGVQNNPGPREI